MVLYINYWLKYKSNRVHKYYKFTKALLKLLSGATGTTVQLVLDTVNNYANFQILVLAISKRKV